MKIKYCSHYEDMSQSAFESINKDLIENANRLFCLATGNSPTGLYKKMEDAYHKNPEYFKELSVLKLDEWGGLSLDHPDSCEAYLRNHIIKPLHISEDHFISFKSDTRNPENECERIQNELTEKGPIDICVLGLGKNGHIGFNEPAESLTMNCHVGQLSKTSMQHQMTSGMKTKPQFGLTLGMADILQSKKIILLITGSGKESVIEKLLSKKITTQLPASFLWLHPNVECYIDSKCLGD